MLDMAIIAIIFAAFSDIRFMFQFVRSIIYETSLFNLYVYNFSRYLFRDSKKYITVRFQKPDSLAKLYEMDDSMERRTWLDKLVTFMEERRTPITSCPTISKNPLDLFRLYIYVKERGGFMEVCKVQCSSIQPLVSYVVSIVSILLYVFFAFFICSSIHIFEVSCVDHSQYRYSTIRSFEVSVIVYVQHDETSIDSLSSTPQNTLYFTSMLNCA